MIIGCKVIEYTMTKLSKEEIIAWLEQYDIENYTLIPDLQSGFVVSVAGDVNLRNKKLEAIPLKFNIVRGNFDCSNNILTSLRNCPASVGGSFYCYHNRLNSLKYCPKVVGGEFYCGYNQLTSLQYCPQTIHENFACNYNKLKSLEGGPTLVGGDFDCNNNQLTSLQHCPTSVGGNFSCYINELTSLEYCPASVGSCYFECFYNPLLGSYQNITDFIELTDKLRADKEKSLLSNSLHTSAKGILHKL